MDNQEIITTYQRLSRVSGILLNSPQYITGDIEQLQRSFYEDLAQLLQAAMDLNVTARDIKEFHEKTKGQPDDIEIMKFTGKLIDTPKTYLMFSYYYANFIKSFIKNCKDESREEVLKLIYEMNVSEKLLDEVEDEYKKMTSHIDTIS